MEIKNLDKLPESVQRIIKPYVEELVKTYGENVISIFAYGSITGRYYDPKRSDINLAVVLKEVSLEKLKQALKTVKGGIRCKINAPLFLSPSYIKMSLDTFPMEFMSMKDSSLVLYGDDCLAGISVTKEDLRRECEYQLKGKILTIRQAYLEQALSRKGIEKLIKSSFRALMPVFQNVLRIEREEAPPTDKQEILAQLGEEFDMDVSPFLDILHDKKTEGRIGGLTAEAFLKDFLKQLEHITNIVDQMEAK